MNEGLSANHVTVAYGARRIVNDVTMRIEPGEFVTIIGRSGVGKSTFLHAVAGFVACRGEIIRPEKIGMVFQRDALFPWLTVEENVAVGLRDVPRTARRAQVREILTATGLAELTERYPSQLSGGQAQRVAVARAVAPSPGLILMDEPLGGLDLLTREEVQLWLATLLHHSGAAVLLVTHSIEEAIFLSDRVLVLEQGEITKHFQVPFDRPRLATVKFDPAFLDLKRAVGGSL
jgi:NitT/TauT family transport system ATP-binding protein